MHKCDPTIEYALDRALKDLLVEHTKRMPGDRKYIEIAGVKVLQICPNKPGDDFVVLCSCKHRGMWEMRVTWKDELYHRTFSQEEKELFSIAEGRIATKRKERLARAARKEPGIGGA